MNAGDVSIHPTAIVHPGAQLDAGVVVGPFCIVGAHAKVGKGTRIISHAVVEGHTTLGENNVIYPFASVGHAPQDLKYRGEPTTLVIGDGNTIRESATLQPGTIQDKGTTIVGSRNLFMAYTHIAHDCVIGDENIFANVAHLAGHVLIGNQAVLGSMCAIHQFSHIGNLAMLAAGAKVSGDVPPFCTVQGDRATLRGLNVVGLRRRGVDATGLSRIKQAYRYLFLGGAPTIEDAVTLCAKDGLDQDKFVSEMITFVKNAKRGVVRPAENDLSLRED